MAWQYEKYIGDIQEQSGALYILCRGDTYRDTHESKYM